MCTEDLGESGKAWPLATPAYSNSLLHDPQATQRGILLHPLHSVLHHHSLVSESVLFGRTERWMMSNKQEKIVRQSRGPGMVHPRDIKPLVFWIFREMKMDFWQRWVRGTQGRGLRVLTPGHRAPHGPDPCFLLPYPSCLFPQDTAQKEYSILGPRHLLFLTLSP